ncbi:tetratricopeptide repeat-containing sulfotransferase family protein [Peristeroidobacter agariperforans]|uniref:tetratricopeptide repeat-containing sulfotransferase family protein n=1 Tax=Peristeroidobacter agariperforans TaxID=268404 RepID=UPI00101E1B51|nr:sulfotransferase [Peristeroidobacter agariperforans]
MTEAFLQRAAKLFEANQLAAAEAQCRQLLGLQPGHIHALGLLGAILHAQERYPEAEVVFADLTRRLPREGAHWMNLGTARRGAGKYEEALRAYMRAAELGYTDADFYFNVGLTHIDRRDYESARVVLKKALDLAPGDALIRSEYIKACYESMQTEEALAAIRGWTDFSQLAPDQLADVGQRLMNLGETERAEQVISKLAASEIDVHAMLTLAQIMERTNRLPEAQRLMERISSHPRAASLGNEMLMTQARIAQRVGEHEQTVELLRRALAGVTQVHDKHFALFPLAKSLDALKRYDEAFTALTEAHASQVAHLQLTAPMAVARGKPTWEIANWSCDPADIAQWDTASAPTLEESPVFVVAFPRSGTTLLEQTLDAHPQLKSMDEQPIVQAALDDMVAAGVRYPEELGKLTDPQLTAIRARYFERAGTRIRLEPGQRVVDKNPLNMLRLPAIKRLFPNAPIILAVRHPCDVVLSCFMQHFRAPHFVMLCSSLQALADGYRRSFDFWYCQSALLAPHVLEVRYESFVADFERGVREIAEFLRLPWHDGMLAPAEHARAKGYISTPSYSQVVQPVNQKAVGRWRAYERHLAPVIPQLRTYLQRWDYSDR